MGVRALAGSLITTSLWKVQLEPFCDLPEGPLAIPPQAVPEAGRMYDLCHTGGLLAHPASNTLEALHDR